VSEYFLNNYRVFDTGNYVDETGKFATNISLLEGLLMANGLNRYRGIGARG
jgi:hypothetical protein